MHGGDHVTGVTHGGRFHFGHDGRSSRPRDDQSARREALQGFANGGAAHAQPFGQLAVAQALARGERAVDDRVPQTQIDVVAQQRSSDLCVRAWDGHAMYCTQDSGRSQADPWQP